MDYLEPEGNPELWLYSLRVVNERKSSGRIILAVCDVRILGFCILGVVLLLNCEGEMCLAMPRARGNRRAFQFKDPALYERIKAKCVATYRELAAKQGRIDMSSPAPRQEAA